MPPGSPQRGGIFKKETMDTNNNTTITPLDRPPDHDRLESIREAAAQDMAFYAAEREYMGHISQKSLAESFQRLHTGLYAYDHEAGTWRRWWFGRWKESREILSEVGHHVRAMLPGDTASVHKAWLNLPTFKAVERLTQAGLEGRWNADPHPLIGYDNGLALDVSSATVRQVDWDSYISRYLPESVVGDCGA